MTDTDVLRQLLDMIGPRCPYMCKALDRIGVAANQRLRVMDLLWQYRDREAVVVVSPNCDRVWYTEDGPGLAARRRSIRAALAAAHKWELRIGVCMRVREGDERVLHFKPNKPVDD